MKDLKDNIRESLFSGGDIDMDSMSKNTEDLLKCEVIKKYGGKDMISGYIDVEVKNGEVYLSPSELSKKRPRVLQLETEQLPKDIFPLNIKQLDGDCYSFVININTSNIKSLEEIFAPGFKNNLTSRRETSKTPLVIIIYGCNNLTSLKGCPKTVRSFSILYNYDLKSFKGMPSFICQDLLVETSDFTIDIKAEDQEHSAIKPRGVVPESHALKIAKNIYSMLDPKCGVAKMLKFKIEEMEFRHELGDLVTQAARRMQKTQF